jgi:hypothetical protein
VMSFASAFALVAGRGSAAQYVDSNASGVYVAWK